MSISLSVAEVVVDNHDDQRLIDLGYSEWARKDLTKRYDKVETILDMHDHGVFRPGTAEEAKAHPRISASKINEDCDGYWVEHNPGDGREFYRQQSVDDNYAEENCRMKCVTQWNDDGECETNQPGLLDITDAVAFTEGTHDALRAGEIGIPVSAIHSPMYIGQTELPSHLKVYIGDIDTIYGKNNTLFPLVTEQARIKGLRINVAPGDPDWDYSQEDLPNDYKWGLEDAINKGGLTREGLRRLISDAMEPVAFVDHVLRRWIEDGITYRNNPHLVNRGIEAAVLATSSPSKLNALKSVARRLGVTDQIWKEVGSQKRRNAITRKSESMPAPLAEMGDELRAAVDYSIVQNRKLANPTHVGMLIALGGIPGLRWNQLKRQPEWHNPEANKFEPFEIDNAYLKLTHHFPGLHVDKTVAKDQVRDMVTRNPFNPLAEAMENWQLEDGEEPMSVEDIAATFGIDSSDVLSIANLLVWLGGVVRRWRVPGSKVDEMLILMGFQGFLKTFILRTIFGAGFSTTVKGADQLDSQNGILKTSSYGAVIIDECEVYTVQRNDSEIKNYLSETVDEVVQKYSNLSTDLPRHFVVCGTTNEQEILRDPTGSRRFLLVYVAKQTLAPDVDDAYLRRFWGTIQRLVDQELLPKFFDYNNTEHGHAVKERNSRHLISRAGEPEILKALMDRSNFELMSIDGEYRQVTSCETIYRAVHGEDAKAPSRGEVTKIGSILRSAGLTQEGQKTFRGRPRTRVYVAPPNLNLFAEEASVAVGSLGSLLGTEHPWFRVECFEEAESDPF